MQSVLADYLARFRVAQLDPLGVVLEGDVLVADLRDRPGNGVGHAYHSSGLHVDDDGLQFGNPLGNSHANLVPVGPIVHEARGQLVDLILVAVLGDDSQVKGLVGSLHPVDVANDVDQFILHEFGITGVADLEGLHVPAVEGGEHGGLRAIGVGGCLGVHRPVGQELFDNHRLRGGGRWSRGVRRRRCGRGGCRGRLRRGGGRCRVRRSGSSREAPLLLTLVSPLPVQPGAHRVALGLRLVGEGPERVGVAGAACGFRSRETPDDDEHPSCHQGSSDERRHELHDGLQHVRSFPPASPRKRWWSGRSRGWPRWPP